MPFMLEKWGLTIRFAHGVQYSYTVALKLPHNGKIENGIVRQPEDNSATGLHPVKNPKSWYQLFKHERVCLTLYHRL